MIITMQQDKLLRKYLVQVNDDTFEVKNINIPKEIKDELVDIDESNLMLYGKHLIKNVDRLKGR